MTSVSPRPIRLVTFDLYDTLIEIAPSRWERLGFALDKLGVAYDLQALCAADVLAEDFYTEENAKTPIRDLPKADQNAFRIEYMRRWLEAAGIEADDTLATQARYGYQGELDATPRYDSYRATAKTATARRSGCRPLPPA